MKQQKIRPSWRQRTASFMVMVLMAGCLFSDMPSVHAAGEGAPETAERVCAPEEYSVEHHVTAEWEGGYKAEIRITDRSGEPMEGWSLSFCCESAITEVWDGVLTADGDGYQISGTEYNSVIENGESVTVGYTAAGTAEGITDVVLRCEGTGETDSREPSDNEGAGEDVREQAPPEDKSYMGEGYAVDASVTESWEGGYNLRLTVRNTSEEMIHNWGVLFKTQDTVRDLYNAQILSSREGVYLLRNSVYNQDIPAGGSVSFGYTAYYTGAADVPGEYAVSSIEKAVENGDFTVSYLVSDAWESGAVVQVMIENTSERAIEDWILEFDSQMEIAEIWNADLVSYEAGHYILRNVSYAQNIPAGETAVAGMRLSAAPGTEEELLKNVTVRQIVPSGEGGSTPSDNQVSDNNISDNNISGNNVSDNNVSDNNISGNELPEGDTNYLSTGGDGGKIYYKTSYESDVVTAPDGLPCIRNQFLLSADDTVGFAEVEAYLAQNGARIVGYIEATNDYQAEMITDTDMTDLQELTERIGIQAWVRHIGLNYLWLEEAEFHTTDPWSESGNTAQGELNTNFPGGHNWGLEAIDFEGALVNAGVIGSRYASTSSITTDHLTTVRMGIYDTAFDEWHEDLDDNFVCTWNNFEQYECTDHSNCPDNGMHVGLRDAFEEQLNENGSRQLAHGTHVAGIMCAEFNNGTGINGTCIKNELYGYAEYGPERYLPEDKMDNERVHNTFETECGFGVLITNNVKVINYSMGLKDGLAYAASVDTEERGGSAVRYLDVQAGFMEEFLGELLDNGYDFLIVTSAGNDNNDTYYKCKVSNIYIGGYITVEDAEKEIAKGGEAVKDLGIECAVSFNASGNVNAKYNSILNYIPNTSPCYDHILCVGSVSYDKNGFYPISVYSNAGDRVNIYAPGSYIYSTYLTGCAQLNSENMREDENINYGRLYGTSMAAPHVSGVAGLAYNVNPDISAADLKQIIINTAQNINGVHILNAADVVADAVNYNTNEKYNTKLIILDEKGNPVPGARVEICNHAYYWFQVSNAAMIADAVGDTVIYSGVTNSAGYIKLNLPRGYYYVMAEGEIAGEAAGGLEELRLSYEDEIGQRDREMVISDHTEEATHQATLQFHSYEKGDYINEQGFFYNIEIKFWRGWIDTADPGAEPVTDVTVAPGKYGYSVQGLSGGAYTLGVTIPGSAPRYYHIMIPDNRIDINYRFDM